MERDLILVLVIIVLSVVQSVFGVGLLIFGTPALLLLGYPFEQILSYLLPCSIVISIFQVIHGRENIKEFKVKTPLYVLPFVAVGLVFVLLSSQNINIKLYIGLMLFITGITRMSGRIMTALNSFFSGHIRSCLSLTGLIHGVTNMGGAPLTIIMTSALAIKEDVRTNIAYGYLLMAALQMVILFAMQKGTISLLTLVLPLISIFTYQILGNRLFKVSNQAIYYNLMTAFIFLFGLSLVVLK